MTVSHVANLHGQQPTSFVASVKPNSTNEVGPSNVILVRPGQLVAQSVTLRELVEGAYGVEQNQVVDGPAWLDTAHFEVKATIPVRATLANIEATLQGLLKERFKLVSGSEQRDLPDPN